MNIDPRHAPEITGHSRPVASRADRGPGLPSGVPSSDRIEISPEAQAFQRVRPRLDDLGEAGRAERLGRLQQALASGRYAVTGEALASAMLRDDALARVLGVPPSQ